MANPTYNGVEMPVFTLAPQWSAGLKVRQTHKTIIREALDLSEERRRASPRALFGIDYDAMTLSAQETGYHRKVIEQAQAMPVGCPFWPHMVLLTADAASGATELQIEDCGALLFTSLKYALVMDRFDNWEVVTIDSISDDGLTLTLTDPTLKDWTAAEDPFTGARVYPMMYGALKRPAFTAINDEESTAKIEFDQKQYDFRDEEPPGTPIVTMTQSPCGELITFTWTPQFPDHYVLESSPDAVDWTIFKADIDGGEAAITLSNPFGAGYWWRLTAVGFGGAGVSVPMNSAAPEIEPCEIALTGCTLLPDVTIEPYGRRQIMINPVSVRENSLVAQDSTYLWITDRYDFYIDQDSSGLYLATIDVTCPTPDAIVYWSTDGTDPGPGASNVHTLPQEAGFGCIVKARACLNGCYGPMTVILIDKRVDVITSIDTQGNYGGAASSARCTHYSWVPQPDLDHCNRITTYSLGSIDTAGPAVSNMAPAVSITRQIINSATSLSGGSNGVGGDTVDGGPSAFCYADYEAGQIDSTSEIFVADHVTFARDDSFWDAQQSGLRSYMIGFSRYYPRVTGFSGAGGGGATVKVRAWFQGEMEFHGLVIAGLFPGPIEDPFLAFNHGEVLFELAQIVMTRDKDTAISIGEWTGTNAGRA